MANLTVEIHTGVSHRRNQEFSLQFPKTEQHTRVIWFLLRAFYDSASGKSLCPHEQLVKAFGDKHRQKIQTVEQEVQKRGCDILASLGGLENLATQTAS